MNIASSAALVALWTRSRSSKEAPLMGTVWRTVDA